MKIYVIPVEKLCNGTCNFCITKFRKNINSDFLDISKLEQLNKFKNIEKIEITGGGEPSLNQNIQTIIDFCSEIAKTSIYTNGTLNLPKNENIEICISRIHYDDSINKKLMGIDYDLNKFNSNNVKLSLMLHRNAINSKSEIINYLNWAKKQNARKVVIRKIAFNNNWNSYNIAKENNVEIDDKDIEQIIEKYQDFAEFDLESCNNNNSNIILRSNGNFYLDWDSNEAISEENFLLSYLKKISLTSTCLGRKVSSIIIKDNKVLGIGSNSNSDCLTKRICNRIVSGKKLDYSHCLCTHAEINSINDALSHNNDLLNSKIFVYGHHNVCEDCKQKLDQYKIDFEIIK